MYEKILYSCLEQVRKKTDFRPKIALVLGSGLGDFAEKCDIITEISYRELSGFPTSTIKGHIGRFIFTKIKGTPTVIMQGRVHYYEGYSTKEAVMPIRLMGLMGVEAMMLTNAAGAVNTSYEVSDMMMITDHISSFVPSPLIGANFDNLGVRFPDMSVVYDKHIRNIIKNKAVENLIPLREGVYLQLTGPNYETPAEIRMYRTLGADVVGMSTAIEAMAARHMGIKVCGISCITNMAADVTSQLLSHEEVAEKAKAAYPKFEKLLNATIPALN